MLEVTDRAAGELRTALSDSRESRKDCFRVFIRENCLEVIADEHRAADVALEHDDEVLLVMDQATAECLSGHKLDYDATVSRLVLI
jgi:Fe-S cluster assembly iron-binding protein IscA